MLKHPSFSHGGETPDAGKMRIPNQKRKKERKKGGEKNRVQKQEREHNMYMRMILAPRFAFLGQTTSCNPARHRPSLSLSPYRLALFTRSAKAHTKLPRPSSHASAAPHTLKSRSQFYVPKIPTNCGELSANLTPRTIPEIQVPIRCTENSNQLGRSACHFDTPDNTRTPGPNSRSRNFPPTGESCPPF